MQENQPAVRRLSAHYGQGESSNPNCCDQNVERRSPRPDSPEDNKQCGPQDDVQEDIRNVEEIGIRKSVQISGVDQQQEIPGSQPETQLPAHQGHHTPEA